MMRFSNLVVFVVGGCAFATAQPVPLRPVSTSAQEAWEVQSMAAMRALKSNRLADAVAACEAAMQIARTMGPHDTHVSRTQVLRAEIYLWQKQYDQAEKWFKDAVTSCELAVGSKDLELVHPLASLANFYYYAAPHYDRVAALFTQILDIVEHAPGHDEHDVIMWSRNLGSVYLQMGAFAKAEPLFIRAVSLSEKIDPQWLPHELVTAADFYRSWQKFDQAERLARRAVGLQESALTAAPSDVDAKLDLIVALDEFAAVELAAAKLPVAEQAARRSLALSESYMTPDQPELQPRLRGLATVLAARGKLDEAAGCYKRLVTVTEKNLGPDSADLARVLSDYALVLKKLGRESEAGALESRAESIRHRVAAQL